MTFHRDTERALKALREVPSIREEFEASERVGEDVLARLSTKLNMMEGLLIELAARYFEAYPGRTTAPYAVFLVGNQKTNRLDLVPEVGHLQIESVKVGALATLMEGEVGVRDE